MIGFWPAKTGKTDEIAALEHQMPQGGEMPPEARELWEKYLAETDPESRELLYAAYMRALKDS